MFRFVRIYRMQPYNPAKAWTLPVWALPVSLAATQGIDISFCSSAYLDVSVQRVSFLIQDICSRRWVVPFGDPRVDRLCAPNRDFSQLAASFFASESLGIRRVLLLVSSVPVRL